MEGGEEVSEASEEGSLTTPDGLPREVDVSQTVGWFTAMYPVTIDLASVGATTKKKHHF